MSYDDPQIPARKSRKLSRVLHLRFQARQGLLRLCVLQGTEQLFFALCPGDPSHRLPAAPLWFPHLCVRAASLVGLITCQSGILRVSRPLVLPCRPLNRKLFHAKIWNVDINITTSTSIIYITYNYKTWKFSITFRVSDCFLQELKYSLFSTCWSILTPFRNSIFI